MEPTCICNPKRLKCLKTRLDPTSIYFLVSKANAPSSTYSMQKSSKRVPWENFIAGWLVIIPEDWGELLFRLNLIICKLFFTHFCSSVSENDIMINRNSTSEKILFVYPTSKGMDISISQY